MISPIRCQFKNAHTSHLSFPDDETRQVWLPLLPEADAMVDAGVSETFDERRAPAAGA